jgi:diadenosine tetraphosphate (Ap4A) HIT family hydrolase
MKQIYQEHKIFSRQPVTTADMEAYIHRCQYGSCFICEMITGNPEYRHHIIYEDDSAIVFLNKYPVLYGYTLVVPREHREQATTDFTLDEYLTLQRLIYQVSEALRQVVPTERVYILTLGSQQGNKHVHWHIAPLPPGVPYQEQQFEALQATKKGILKLSDEEMASLALQIRQAMNMEIQKYAHL